MENRIKEVDALQQEVAEMIKLAQDYLSGLYGVESIIQYQASTQLLACLEQRYNQLCLEKKKLQMTECDHIWIITEIAKGWDGHSTTKHYERSCIKCGLDTRILQTSKEYLSPMQQIMRQELLINGITGEHVTDIACDFDLAVGIYQAMIRENPERTDQDAINYLRYYLEIIRSSKTSSTKRSSMFKELKLGTGYNRWQKTAVINYN